VPISIPTPSRRTLFSLSLAAAGAYKNLAHTSLNWTCGGRSGVKGRGRERDAPMCQHAVDAATHEEAHYDEWQLFHGLLVVIDTTGPSIPPA